MTTKTLQSQIRALELPEPFDAGDGNHEDKFTESQFREFRKAAADLAAAREKQEAVASRQLGMLAKGITEAARKAGIYNGEVDLIGPHLLMFLDDLASVAKEAGEKQAAAPVALGGVKEQLEEGGGFWHPCSGCHETEDGHPVGNYAYSEFFKCELGKGCSECGGIGAVWDNTDYDEMYKPTMEEDLTHEFTLDVITRGIRYDDAYNKWEHELHEYIRVECNRAAIAASKLHAAREQVDMKVRIREIFLAHGFTIKEGQADLKPYVYEAAYALLAASQQAAEQVAADSDISEAVQLLAAVFDAWENGVECYEDPEENAGFLGMAFQLDTDVFDRCCTLLNRRNPPRNAPAIQQVEHSKLMNAIQNAYIGYSGEYLDAGYADEIAKEVEALFGTPAIQQPQDERAAFEAYAVSEEGGWMPAALNRQQYGDDYTNGDVQAEWRSWQARAALAKGGT